MRFLPTAALLLIFFLPLNASAQKKISPSLKYDLVRPYHDGRAAVKKNEKWGFIDKRGNEIIPVQYIQVSDFVEQMAVAFSNEWIVINTNGIFKRKVSQRFAERFIPSFNKPEAINARNNVSQFSSSIADCPPNIDFEFGDFSNWYCYKGIVTSPSGVNTITWFNNNPPVNTPSRGRHTIITASVPSAVDPYGLFPTNAPDGSGHSVKLGNDLVHDSSEKIRYVIHVPLGSDNYSVIFQYAAVLENPNGNPDHLPGEKPKMEAQVKDSATGNVFDCANFLYVAASNISGFYNSSLDTNVKCKNWTPVFVNLSGYGGRTIYLDFITADCTQGAHFGYAYIDVACSQIVNVIYSCDASHQTILTAPPGYVGYNWFDSTFTPVLGTNQVLTLNPSPPLHSSFYVEVIPEAGNGCRDTVKVEVIASLPLANAGPDRNICSPVNVYLGAAPIAGYTYQWSPPDYLSGTNIANPIATLPVSATYIVTVTDIGNCSSNDTVYIQVRPKPTAGFTVANQVQCARQGAFSFNNESMDPSGSYTNFWTFGDGTTSTAGSPSHTFILPGTYNVTLTIGNGLGCKDSIVHTVTVRPDPLVNFNITNNTQCFSGNNVVFVNHSSISSGSLNYLWTFGDGTTSTQTSPNHHFTSSGTFSVQLLVTSNAGCSDSITSTASILPSPAVAFVANPASQCMGTPFIFSNGSSGGSGDHWTFGDGAFSTQLNPTHSYSAPGTYTVQLNVNGLNGCDDSIRHAVTLYPLPSADFIVNADTQCLNVNHVVFSNHSGISSGSLSYNWNFGDGITSQQTSPTHNYTAPGNYTASLLGISNMGCRDSLTLPILIHQGPDVNLSANPGTVICEGNNVQLHVTGGTMFSWAPSTGLSCINCTDPVVTPLNNVTYIVTGSDNFNCSGKDTINLIVQHPFTITAVSDTICRGDSARLSAMGANNYSWSPATGINNTVISNPHASPISTIVYTVIGSDGFNCFADTAYSIVVVGQPLSVSLGADLSFSTGTVYQFEPVVHNGPPVSWTWTPSNGLSCYNCPHPVISITKDITYTLNIRDRYGCTATDFLTIRTFCDNTQVFVPNAFSPDGDGVNDILMVRGKGIATVLYFRIFNRWGELVFEKQNFKPNDRNYGWDGKVRGVAVPPDVFVYTAVVVCENGTPFTLKGNVSVIR